GGHPAAQVAERVRILRLAARPVEPAHFATVARAVLERRRLQIDAWNRGRDEVNRRTVSPQRLVHYRDNWYLDAWCHWRRALRSFALDTLQAAWLLPQPARELAARTLDRHYAASYGIFSGRARATAVLRFTAERARWVRHEQWHPAQRGEMLPDGSWRLRLPYADPRELVMDILRHGRHVTVESPASLRRLVAAEAQAVAARYAD
ncbi:MAG: WYL domain-containing protein, partial [Steroidobacteraceae bacterium]|nr:WYL domain-containing protein [Steroidobacteraceae bacterium]